MTTIKELNKKIDFLKSEIKSLESEYENSPDYSKIACAILAKKGILKEYRYLIRTIKEHNADKKFLHDRQKALTKKLS